MDLSLLLGVQVSDSSDLKEQEAFRQAIQYAVLADELGFDRVYCVEHHGIDGYSRSSAPEVSLAYIAAKTSRIRIAHGVVCLPFKMNHPVRVAERTSALDILSGGRLDVGFGRSSSVYEQQIFGIEPSETEPQMVEGMRAIVEMWTAEEIEWSSELLRIPRRRIRPRPVQKPHPPMMMACSRDDTLTTAGRLGLGVLSNAVEGPDRTRRKREIYDAARAIRQPGDVIGKFANDRFGATVFTCVRDDAAEGRSWGLRGMRYFLESARRYFATGEPPDLNDGWTDEANIAAIRKIFTQAGDSRPRTADGSPPTQKPGAGLLSGTFQASDVLNTLSSGMGTPKNTIEFVERMKDAGVDECYFIVQFGGVPHEVTMESIRQIGKNVIPHFRKSPRKMIL